MSCALLTGWGRLHSSWPKRASGKRTPLVLERLEDRCTPSVDVNPSRILIQFEPDTPNLSTFGDTLFLNSGMVAVQVLPDESVDDAIERWEAVAGVLWAEPDYMVSIAGIPNDPDFAKLWGMDNTGQTGGKVDADIDAPEAWDQFTGSGNFIIASIDTGVNYNHPDIAANMWHNPGETPSDGIDNDANGIIDDFFGADFYSGDGVPVDGDPMDDHSHGTHTSGTMAAVGNNTIGVAGVIWDAQVMAVKFLGAGGSGFTVDAIKSVNYAASFGVEVSNNSWGGGAFSQGLYDAIKNSGSLFVAAAGNSARDADLLPMYPAAYDLPNIISVAATDHNDLKASFSNWGKVSVDLGAPGVTTWSLGLGDTYKFFSGTSMASPHVAGAVALYLDSHPTATLEQAKAALLASVDPIPAFADIVVSGGRLNVDKLIGDLMPPPPENHPPVAVDDAFDAKFDEQKLLDVLANDADPDAGDTIKVASVQNAVNCAVSIDAATGQVLFKPTTGFSGQASFEYTIADKAGLTDSALVKVQVAPAPPGNLPPDAVDDSFDVRHPSKLDVLANDADPDGDPLKVVSVQDAVNCKVWLDDNGAVHFKADSKFIGQAIFSYTITDPSGAMDTANVTVNVAKNGGQGFRRNLARFGLWTGQPDEFIMEALPCPS